VAALPVLSTGRKAFFYAFLFTFLIQSTLNPNHLDMLGGGNSALATMARWTVVV
jgi:hypothetical protein